jgi:uncharacterized protein (UPF0128 family)
MGLTDKFKKKIVLKNLKNGLQILGAKEEKITYIILKVDQMDEGELRQAFHDGGKNKLIERITEEIPELKNEGWIYE